jgi:hypothetical protein
MMGFRIIAKSTLLRILPPIFRFANRGYDLELTTRRFYKAATWVPLTAMTGYELIGKGLRPSSPSFNPCCPICARLAPGITEFRGLTGHDSLWQQHAFPGPPGDLDAKLVTCG